MEELRSKLRVAHEETKLAHHASVVKALPSMMEQGVSQARKRVKLIMDQFNVLEKSNEESQSLPKYGPSSSTDRTRTSIFRGLGKKLKEKMDEF
ncbi:hypothetical protein RDABS01_015588 [Bienertia sinuspersici]